MHKRDSFSADYIRDMYSPSQAEGVPAFASNTRVSIQLVLPSGDTRQLDVPINWTSEQVLIDLFGSGPESREYFLRCADDGSGEDSGAILHRTDLVQEFVNHTLVVTSRVGSMQPIMKLN